MKYHLAFLLVSLEAVFAIAGCGGSGSSTGSQPKPLIFPYQGVSITPWSKDDLSGPNFLAKLDLLKSDGVNAVAINQWLFQDNSLSTDIALDFIKYSCSDASLVKAFTPPNTKGFATIKSRKV